MHNQTAILFFYKGKKMKLLSFAIPCYNSKDYMEHCIESILPGGDDVEIIIVDDGSKDETAAIADRYAAEYPDIVKAVHQENGGHGEAVNTGLKNATGKYFKVVDSDDWVDLESYKKILDKLREFEQENTQIDMLLANYVYEKEGAKRKKVMRQTGFPRNEIFTWSDIKHIHKGHYILMHSVHILVSNDVKNPDDIDVDKVFERFYKADEARSISSSGLGLSIAKELVERMGGSIEARLEGKRFVVEIQFECE